MGIRAGFVALSVVLLACGAPKAPSAVQLQAEGEWMPYLATNTERRLAVVRHAAMAEPPAEGDLEKINATDAERKEFESLVTLKKSQPSSPLLKKVRDALDAVDATKVEVTADELIIIDPAHHQRMARHYVVDHEDATSITLTMKRENVTFRFKDADHAKILTDAGNYDAVRKPLFWAEITKP